MGISDTGDGGAVVGDVVEVMPPELPDLPAGLCEEISDFILSYCEGAGIDIYKASAQNWTAVCMVVGSHIIKKNRIIYDEDKTARAGRAVYDPVKALALADLWYYFCCTYGKPPLQHDYCYFAGVGLSWLKNNNGNSELTSASVHLIEKIRDMQEVGLSSRLIDGKGSPVGTIFFLKNWHGWRDERQIVHETAQAQPQATELPDFSSGAALPGHGGTDEK